MKRRDFIKRVSLGGIVTASTLGTLGAHFAGRAGERRTVPRPRADSGKHGAGYGPLFRAPDQHGRQVLALPRDFRYVTFSCTGEPMSDATATPRNPDGMACFEGPRGTVRLIRNHELRNHAGDFDLGVGGPASTRYDARAAGGCVTLDFDTRRKRLVRSFVSLNGTYVNCAGGLAYGDAAWISCEETTAGPAQGFERPHGYNFLVPRDLNAPAPAVPVTAMGRFAHEASVADNASGIVYQTEDAGDDSGFYRFLPNDPANLLQGGVLQMLAVKGRPNHDTRTAQIPGAALPVEWVTIDDPDPRRLSTSTSCFAQGFAAGGARFNRLEGIFRGEDGSIFFVSTHGGDAGCGQLWQYLPGTPRGGGGLALRFESPAGGVLDSPDNLCVTPSGAVLFCEDNVAGNEGHSLAPGLPRVSRLVGLAPEGEAFEFAVNVLNASELAGACFSPDGEILFVNIFGNDRPGSGMTCAVWGPWRRGPL